MRLRNLALKNFRRFDTLELDFHPELSVVVARNGQGKTTVLEAIAVALGPFVGAFDHGVSSNISKSDARYVSVGDGNEQMYPVEVSATLLYPEIPWSRALNGPKSKTTQKEAATISAWGKGLQLRARHHADVSLPVVAYYSSQRLWVAHKTKKNSGQLSTSRTMGYEDCLSSSSSFRQMVGWLGEATVSLIQEREFPGDRAGRLEERLLGIKNAVDSVMLDEGWKGFHYSIRLGQPAMYHPDHGVLPLTILSDGIRAMISLVADLALRCVRLNGHYGARAPELTEGIVLVDEIDLHLHPAWQQRVIASLRRAFPKIQFIVSTHSPQVISTVASESIRVIQPSSDPLSPGRFEVRTPATEVEGVSSAMAMSEIFGVNPEPETEWSQRRSAYLTYVQSGQAAKEEALQLLRELEEHFGSSHPWVVELDQVLRIYELRKRAEVRRSDAAKTGAPEGGDA